MLTRGKAIAKIIWCVVNFVLFVVVSCLMIIKAVNGEVIDFLTTLGIVGTGLNSITILEEIYLELPKYIEVLRKR